MDLPLNNNWYQFSQIIIDINLMKAKEKNRKMKKKILITLNYLTLITNISDNFFVRSKLRIYSL